MADEKNTHEEETLSEEDLNEVAGGVGENVGLGEAIVGEAI